LEPEPEVEAIAAAASVPESRQHREGMEITILSYPSLHPSLLCLLCVASLRAFIAESELVRREIERYQFVKEPHEKTKSSDHNPSLGEPEEAAAEPWEAELEMSEGFLFLSLPLLPLPLLFSSSCGSERHRFSKQQVATTLCRQTHNPKTKTKTRMNLLGLTACDLVIVLCLNSTQ
jgi:hypothetical protein